MVRTVKIGHEENDVDEDKEFDVSPPEGKEDSRRVQKASGVRSKHSETEQRRRIKINERFQTLMDLIPANDQKRDKASFLLEVIQYVQFLQERVQLYEGTCQGWSPEPSKLMSWRGDLGSGDNFLDQPQLVRNGSGSETNVAVCSKPPTGSQNSIDSDLSGNAFYRIADNPSGKGNHGITPVQLNMFESVPAHPSQGSFPEPDCHLPDQFHSEPWLSRSSPEYFGGPRETTNPQNVKPARAEANISDDYSQGLFNTLSNALRSSGVDMSHTNISVQLDVRQRTTDGTHIDPLKQGGSSFPEMGSYIGTVENYDQTIKKLKTIHR